jgi:hypothetical protein
MNAAGAANMVVKLKPYAETVMMLTAIWKARNAAPLASKV